MTCDGDWSFQRDQPHDYSVGASSHMIPAQPLGRGGEQEIEFSHRGNHSVNFVFVMPQQKPNTGASLVDDTL